MKKFVLLSAIGCAVFCAATSAATASAPLMVIGAGRSQTSGSVVVHARATQPLVGLGSQEVPAVGFLRAPSGSSPFGGGPFNFNGKVTCIADWLGPAAAAVSGTLDTPVVSNGVVLPNFTLTVRDFGANGEYLELWLNRLGDPNVFGSDECGIGMFFMWIDGFPAPPQLSVERGHFAIHGPFKVG